MKFFVILLLINFNFCKIDPIFKIKANFIQKGGKTIFALNPQKILPKIEKEKQKEKIQKKLLEK